MRLWRRRGVCVFGRRESVTICVTERDIDENMSVIK